MRHQALFREHREQNCEKDTSTNIPFPHILFVVMLFRMMRQGLLLLAIGYTLCGEIASFSPVVVQALNTKRKSTPVPSAPASRIGLVGTFVAKSTNFANEESSQVSASSPGVPLFKRIKDSWFSSKHETVNDDLDEKALKPRQRLKRRGVAAVSAFTFLNQVIMACTFATSWFLHAKRTGLSPTAPGQWKMFLALNTGFVAATKVLTPLAVGVALWTTPLFERMIDAIHTRLGMSRGMAVGTVVVLTSGVGGTAMTVLGIVAAAALARVPIFP